MIPSPQVFNLCFISYFLTLYYLTLSYTHECTFILFIYLLPVYHTISFSMKSSFSIPCSSLLQLHTNCTVGRLVYISLRQIVRRRCSHAISINTDTTCNFIHCTVYYSALQHKLYFIFYISTILFT